jgi:hypothetical protein
MSAHDQNKHDPAESKLEGVKTSSDVLWPASYAVACLFGMLYFIYLAISGKETVAIEGSVFYGAIISLIWLIWTSFRLYSLVPLAALPVGYVISVLITAIARVVVVGGSTTRQTVLCLLGLLLVAVLMVYGIREVQRVKKAKE